jgi:DNA-binding NarL/FixJ family response regulator
MCVCTIVITHAETTPDPGPLTPMLQIRILVVDPSKGLLRYLRQVFENFSFDSRNIKTAETPEAALELATRLKPDLLLTDWFDDEPLTGLALYSKLRALNPRCQVAFLRTGIEPQHTDAAQQAGALFLLQKPCTAQQLLTALGKALQDVGKINPMVNAQAQEDAATAARHLATLKRVANLAPLKPGDTVVHQGSRATVKHAIVRQGEMMVQLEGVEAPVPVAEVQRA